MLPNGVTRTAKYLGSQGCVTLPIGERVMNFKSVAVNSRLPDPTTQPWPMGDMLPQEPLPTEIDAEKLNAAVNAAFQPAEGLTAAFVVTWQGRLIAERYAEGLTAQTPLEGWTMARALRQRSLAFWSKTASMIWTSWHRFLNGKPPRVKRRLVHLRASRTASGGQQAARPKIQQIRPLASPFAVLEGDKLAAAGQGNGIVEPSFPTPRGFHRPAAPAGNQSCPIWVQSSPSDHLAPAAYNPGR